MIALSKEIDLSLEKLIKDGESRVLKRALVIKMLKSGASTHYIKSVLNMTNTFISNDKNKYYNEGALGLLLSDKDSVSYLSQAAKSSVLPYIKSQISIDLDSLIHYIKENYSVVYKSKQSYYALLNEAGLSYHKSKKSNPQKDLEESNSKNQSLAMDRVQNYFATPAAPVRTLYDVIMDEAELRGERRGVQIGESRGIQIGKQYAKMEILQFTIASMWEHLLPMPQIALFSRLTIEEVQDFMRKIVGDDNMQSIELQWNKGISIEDIAKNTNMEIAFIQRIVDYVLDYKTEDDNKIAQA